MKKLMSLILISIMILSGVSAFADIDENASVMPVLKSAPLEAVTTLYEEENKVKFEVKQDGDNFTIILDENASTGYSWVYNIADEEHVTFVGDKHILAETDLMGASSKREFYFKVNAEGVSTISFEYKRPWEEEAADILRLLVYKSGEKVFVEEDDMVNAIDTVVPVLYETNAAYYNDELIESDVKPQVIDGVTMIPLRSTVEKMGYEVTWNGEKRSVEIKQGAQWTSIKIGENAYFKNKMASAPLSAAPLIVDDRTLVPAEFFNVILSKGLMIVEGNLKLNDNEMVTHSGYVKEINYDETGTMNITLTTDMESDGIMLQTIIHTSKAYTYINKEVVEGEYINVISSMIMTMSIPGQTSGYVIY